MRPRRFHFTGRSVSAGEARRIFFASDSGAGAEQPVPEHNEEQLEADQKELDLRKREVEDVKKEKVRQTEEQLQPSIESMKYADRKHAGLPGLDAVNRASEAHYGKKSKIESQLSTRASSRLPPRHVPQNKSPSKPSANKKSPPRQPGFHASSNNKTPNRIHQPSRAPGRYPSRKPAYPSRTPAAPERGNKSLSGWSEGVNENRFKQWMAEQQILDRSAVQLSGIQRIALNGERWELGRIKTSTSDIRVLRRSDRPEISIMLPMDVRLSSNELRTFAVQAEQNQKNQERDLAKMGEGFEIADSKKPMAYLELFDGSDPGIVADHNGHAGFPDMLSQRYKVLTSPDGYIDASKANPIQALRSLLTALVKSGVKQFYIMSLGHGSEGSFGFGNNRISPEAFKTIFAEFSDCKFTFNTLSCYGGGLANAMKTFRDESDAKSGRVTVFTQTKPDVPNLGTQVKRNSSSTRYIAALTKYLLQGCGGRPGQKLSYGEAHLLADKEAKREGFCDAEVYSSRPGDRSRYTADTNKPRTDEQTA